MGAPQIIMIILQVLGIGIHLARHGEETNDTYNFITRTFSALVVIGLLYWGGFFK